MPSSEPLCRLLGINYKKLSKEEYFLLEAEIFLRICQELKEFFRRQQNLYFCLMKFNLKEENIMLENSLARLVTNDILASGEYNLSGIAYYSDTPEDIIQEISDGRNTRPSAIYLWKIIELHRSIRKELYDEIIKKIISYYSKYSHTKI